MKTLAMLQNPSAKLMDVDPSVAQHYHDKLLEARREKAHVRHTDSRRWYSHSSGPQSVLLVPLLALVCALIVQVSLMQTHKA